MTTIPVARTNLTTVVTAVATGLVLGAAGAVAGLAVVVWSLLGRPTRTRVLALAALGVLATAIAWLAAGVPTGQEVAVFTNLGGRDWVDAPARVALALVAMAAVQPERPAPATTNVRRIGDLWEVDRLRAVAIVAVVIIHGLPFRAPITGYIDYWLSDLLRFSVATFFLVSGWLLPRDLTGLKWLRHRLGRIIPAYLLASVLLLLVARVSPLIESRPAIQAILLGDAVGPYYFVVVLIVLTIVTPLLQRLSDRARWWLLGVSAVVALGIEIADLSLYAHNHLPLTWLPYYVAGYQLRPHRTRILALGDRTRVAIVLCTMAVVVALALAPIETSPRRLLTGLGMWAILATLMVVTTAARTAPSHLTRRLSRQSYLIYLYHPPVVAGIAGTFGSSMLTLRPVVAAVAAIITCLAIGMLARIIWPTRAGTWLGA